MFTDLADNSQMLESEVARTGRSRYTGRQQRDICVVLGPWPSIKESMKNAYIEAISARELYTNISPTTTAMNPYTTATGPPFKNATPMRLKQTSVDDFLKS